MNNSSIGKCNCGGDIEENGANACCAKCGLLYNAEIVKKNHQPPEDNRGYVRTFGIPREPLK